MRVVIMLVTLGRVWAGLYEIKIAVKVGSDVVWGTGAELGGGGELG